ncbi:MAG TPA: EAL domain-containing protein [Rhodocyclaceae bacterium]|nr:EAL domain-containing protein [Rhodocyclaceae bacterium]
MQALKNAKVMLVDDEPIMMDVVQAFLEDAGYTSFLTTDDPGRVLDMLLKERPDVLLLDLIMPGKSGFKLLTEIRDEPLLRYMPVIVLTAASDAETKLQALDLGATDFLAKPVDASELRLRLRNTLAFKAYQDQLAYYDALTGLPNRQLFLDRLIWTLRLARRHDKQCALLQVGLDRFRQINDTLGHEVGDELLKAVSRRLSAALRETDTIGMIDDREDATSLSRLAGDEFTVIISEISHPDDALVITRRLLETMQAPLLLGGHELVVSLSVGIALFPQDGREATDLMTNVGQAMAHSKLTGGNTFSFCSPEANSRSYERLMMETALRKAMERNDLELYYQPKVEPATSRIVGAEALLRWTHADLGPVPPARFIPLAEESGLILELGEMVLRRACEDAVKWRQAGFKLTVSVNVSSIQFRRGDMPSLIQSALQASGLPAHKLRIELTESLLMDNATESLAMLRAIKDLGVTLSIDDFGTGYSSLSYLKQFPLDELKIDRMFVRDLPGDKGNAAIVRAIIAMAHGLDLTVTAEGVETPAEMDFLKTHGCDQFQGFLFGRPIPKQEFSALLAQGAILLPGTQFVTKGGDSL